MALWSTRLLVSPQQCLKLICLIFLLLISIAVHADDPEYRGINELDQLRPHILNEIKIFYEDYKKLDKNSQTVIVKDFLPRSEAMKIIEQGIEGYKQYIREQKKSLTCTRYGSYQNLFKKGLSLSEMDDDDE